MLDEMGVVYPLIKMLVGAMCLLLSAEYLHSYVTYYSTSFGILYIGDCLTWLLAGGILFSEGAMGYLYALRRRRGNPYRRVHA